MPGKHTIILGLLLLGFCAPAAAQQTPEDNPGYINLNDLGFPGSKEPTVEINLSGSLLKMIGLTASEDEPELSATLKHLDAITVRVYSLDDKPAASDLKRVEAISDRLAGNGWETLVRVRKKDEQTFIGIKRDRDQVVGLVVVSVEQNGKLSLVNIVGNINLDEIWRLGKGLKIDHLDSVRSLPTPSRNKQPH